MIQQPNKMYFQDGLLGQPMYDPNMDYRFIDMSQIPVPDSDPFGNPIPVMDSMGRNTPMMSDYVDDRFMYEQANNPMNQKAMHMQNLDEMGVRQMPTNMGGRGGPSDPSAYMPPEEMAVEAPDAGGMSGMQVMNLMKALGGMGGGSEQYDFSTAPGIVRGRPMQQMNFGPSYSQGYTGGLLG